MKKPTRSQCFCAICSFIILLGIIFFGVAAAIGFKRNRERNWPISCNPGDTSPLLSDVEAAIAELITKPIEYCRSLNLTTILHCHGTACISRIEFSEQKRLEGIESYKEHPEWEKGCDFYASWAKEIVERQECWTLDQDMPRVEGRVRSSDEGKQRTVVRVFSKVPAE